jgi:asparagine synthase (glutamine-hydrolysing)
VWFLSKLCKTRCTVAFSGEGADEVFGGYLTYRANRIAGRLKQVPAGAIRLALRGLNALPVSNEKISLEYKMKRLLQGSLLPAEQAHIYWNGTFSESEKAALMKVPLPAALLDILLQLQARVPGDGIAPFLEFDQRYYLPDDILVKSDRISMAHSVEVRPPFLDHRIIEFAASIPTKLKIRGDNQKYVLKELMRPKLKAPITQRKKVGFDIPAHEWFRGPLRSLLMETLESAQRDHAGLFNFEAIDRLTKLHMSRSVNVGYHLWGLMTLFLWMKRWNVQSAPIHQSSRQALMIG